MLESKRKKELSKIIEAASKDLVDRGLIIEAGWESLKALSIPPNAPQIQLDEMRIAFFAGAHYLFGAIMTFLEPGEEPTEKDMMRMSLIHDELERFIEEYKLKHTETKGSA